MAEPARSDDAAPDAAPASAATGASTSSVTDRLRADILSGALPPGERLVELSLSTHYGVGRAAVRAALVELDGEGLVGREANRGATVRRVGLTEAIEITEARGVLEGLLARRAAEHAGPDERAELSDIVDSMRHAVDTSATGEYSALNRTFHRRVCELARHEVASVLVDNLRNRAVHHQFRLSLVGGRAEESLAQHRAVADAIVAGDGDRAERAMRAHLESVASVLRHWHELGVPL